MPGLRRAVLPVALLAVACGGDNLTLPGPGIPATLSIVSGDGQSGAVGEPLALPLVVQLRDGQGRPVPRAMVAFRFSDDPPGAALDPSSSATDSLGQAMANARLGTVPGDQAIDAQVAMPGTDLQVRFQLTAVAKDPPGGGGGGGSAGPPPSSGGGDNSGGGGGDGGSGSGGGGGDSGHGQGNGGGHGHGH